MNDENQERLNKAPERKKGKRLSLIIGFVLIAAVVGAGALWYIRHSEYITNDDAYIDAYIRTHIHTNMHPCIHV